MQASVGSFGEVWLETMQEYQPEECRRLERQHQLLPQARQFNREARRAYMALRVELRHRFPSPAGYHETVQYLTNLNAMAREQILHDLLPVPATPEPQATDEASDSSATI
jgi:hypothetical protein